MSAGPLQAVERAVEAVAAGLGLVSPEVTEPWITRIEAIEHF